MKELKRILRIIGVKNYQAKDKSKGYDHKVYIISTDNKDLVVRIPLKEKNKLIAQAWAFKKWKKIGIPVPRIIKFTTDYLIEEKLGDRDLEESKLSLKKKQEIMYEVGKYAKKMHSIKTKGYGYLTRPGKGSKKTWREFIEPDFKSSLEYIEKMNLISDNLMGKVRTYLEENKHIMNLKDPRLVHGDLKEGNIMVEDGKLLGFIDASDSISGDPYYELGVVSQSFDQSIVDSFLRGYGRINKEKLKFYSIYYATWRIIFDKKDKKKLKKNISKLKHLLKV